MQKRAEKVLLVSESDIIVVGNFGGEQITIPFFSQQRHDGEKMRLEHLSKFSV